MAAELAMAAEIARVLGGGRLPQPTDEPPGSEVGDAGSGEAGPSAGGGLPLGGASTDSGGAAAVPPEVGRAPAPPEAEAGGTTQAPEPGAARDDVSSAPGADGAGEGGRAATGGGPEGMPEAPTAASGGASPGGCVIPADGEVAVVPGVARYHRRACILIRFMGDTDLETMSRQAAEEAGCVACRACQPDEN